MSRGVRYSLCSMEHVFSCLLDEHHSPLNGPSALSACSILINVPSRQATTTRPGCGAWTMVGVLGPKSAVDTVDCEGARPFGEGDVTDEGA